MSGKRGGPRPNAGRPKGGKNKATIEKAIVAEQVVARASMLGRKLAKEVLDEFMHTFAAMAMASQPVPTGAPIPDGCTPDETKFEKYARLAIQCAKDLAGYQSPTFRAVAITGDVEKPDTVRFVVENAPLMIEGTATEQ